MNKRTKSWLAGLLGAALAVAGCQAHEPVETAMVTVPPTAEPSAEVAELVRAHNAFALRVTRMLSPANSNLAYSPLSATSALAMVQLGAAGTTEQELAEAMGVPSASLPALGVMLRGLTGAQLTSAQRVWLASTTTVLPGWSKALLEHFGGEPGVMEAGSLEGARSTINRWVKSQTAGAIEELLPSGSLAGPTSLVVTNAVHFKGRWARPFDPADTTTASFHVNGVAPQEVPMMHASRGYRYGAAEDAAILELPFEGDAYAMIILLPTAVNGLVGVEARLTPEGLEARLASMAPRSVEVALPRFTVSSELQLSYTLSALGMPSLFKQGDADLSGMDGTHDLFVSAMFHKAIVEVNEEGAEASAATGAVVKRRSLNTATPFVVDRPFLFAIRHQATGALLFVGRVGDPRLGMKGI